MNLYGAGVSLNDLKLDSVILNEFKVMLGKIKSRLVNFSREYVQGFIWKSKVDPQLLKRILFSGD